MNILFVCTGNTCRSPMAKVLLEKAAKEKGIKLEIKSAGIYALDGDRPSEDAVKSMRKEGIDLTEHRASMASRDLLEKADLIITMSMSHKGFLLSRFSFIKGKIYTLKEYAYGKDGDIDDPYGRGIYAYDKVRDEIKVALEKMVERMMDEQRRE